jgi:chromosome segregation ATPase
MDFDQELEGLREEREELKEQISELEAELSQKSANTASLREDLEELTESIESNDVPESAKERRKSVRGIDRVPVDQETGKPPRGRRGEQIEQGIKVISRRQETFKAVELFELLKEADPNVTDSQRAYLYSKLNDMRDEGKLEKVKRGTWKLAD